MRPHEDIERLFPIIRNSMSRYLELAREIAKPHVLRTFLDVGGGIGLYTKAAESLGLESDFVEIDERAIDFARRRIGLTRIVQGDIQNLTEVVDREYDLVLARHTIEHLRDPASFVGDLASVVQQGGILIIETPNAVNWEQWAHPHMFRFYWSTLTRENPELPGVRRLLKTIGKPLSAATPPKHLHGFNEQNLTQLLEKVGFTTRKCIATVCGDEIFDPLYYMHLPDTRSKLLSAAYLRYERASSAVIKWVGKGSRLILFSQRDANSLKSTRAVRNAREYTHN